MSPPYPLAINTDASNAPSSLSRPVNRLVTELIDVFRLLYEDKTIFMPYG